MDIFTLSAIVFFVTYSAVRIEEHFNWMESYKQIAEEQKK